MGGRRSPCGAACGAAGLLSASGCSPAAGNRLASGAGKRRASGAGMPLGLAGGLEDTALTGEAVFAVAALAGFSGGLVGFAFAEASAFRAGAACSIFAGWRVGLARAARRDAEAPRSFRVV